MSSSAEILKSLRSIEQGKAFPGLFTGRSLPSFDNGNHNRGRRADIAN